MKVSEDLTCAELVELVTDYFEGALSAPERERFQEHLALCDGCTAYVEQMRRTIEITGTLSQEALDPGMKDRLLLAFRDWKR